MSTQPTSPSVAIFRNWVILANRMESNPPACSPRCPTGLRTAHLIVTLWRAGLRLPKALALHPRDLDNGVLRIRQGKGGKSRTVALDPEAWACNDVA